MPFARLAGAFGMLAPRNRTIIAAFFLCALSAAGEIFLIMEMDTPLDGVIRISLRPMREALSWLGH